MFNPLAAPRSILRPITTPFPLVIAVFFLSGFSSLVYQVAWVKQLTRTFGVTAFAVSAVLGAFFAGLALGSYLGGRLADRRADGLRLYGLLEIIVAFYALCLLALFDNLTPIYRALYPAIQHSTILVTPTRFILSFLLLILPTTLMGATLPLLVRALIKQRDEFASKLSRLYALNTLGAVVGVLSTGYVLIGLFGLRTTTVIAAFGNLLAGLVAILLSRQLPSAPFPAVSLAPAPGPSPVASFDIAAKYIAAPLKKHREQGGELAATRLFSVMFLSGFAALGYELIWTRVFTVLSDHSIFAYSAIVAGVLIGIALGSEWIGRTANRIRDPLNVLALVEIGLGASAVASLPAAAVAARIFPAIDTSFGPARMNGNPIFFFAVVLLVILIPSLCMGASFPLAAQAYARHSRTMGRNVGEIYSANVLGATLGSVVVGFVLLPLVGAQRAMLICAILNLAAAGLLILGRPQRRLILITGGLAATGVAALVVAPPFLYNWLFAAQYPAHRIVANYEDTEMTVTVTEYGGHNFIFLNGHHQAETLPRTLGIHRLIGHLPALLHGSPKTSLVIGLGGGATSGAVAAHTGERVDIVELSPAMVEAAELFEPHNDGVLRDPLSNLVIADGRNFLLLSDWKYDLITADIIPPLHAYSSLLYSVEYYRLLAAHLTEGGLVSQWLDRRLEPHEQMILARTFVRAFPHAMIWQRESYTILLGANEPIAINAPAVAARFTPEVAADLAPLGLTEAAALLNGLGSSDDALRAEIGPGLIISDDHPYNEYFRVLRIMNLWTLLE